MNKIVRRLLPVCATLFMTIGWSTTAFATGTVPAVAVAAKPIYQLRIYRLYDASKAQFNARFRDDCMRIMKKYGFEIVFTTESRTDGRPEFVYLLRWPDEATKMAAWKAFMADAEWAAVKKVTGEKYGVMVDSIEDRMLSLTDYTPPPSTVP